MNTARRRSSRPPEGGSKEKARAAANDLKPKNAKHPRKGRRSPNHDEGNKNKTLNNKKTATMRPRRRDNYEKHRAPPRAPRAGVNGGSAPDGLRVIINPNPYKTKIFTTTKGGGWARGFSPRELPPHALAGGGWACCGLQDAAAQKSEGYSPRNGERSTAAGEAQHAPCEYRL